MMGQAKASYAPLAAEAFDLTEVYREHAETVSRWVRRLVGSESESEDVLHDVFLVVQRKLPGFRGEAQLTTWLYAITVRVVQDRRRRGRWRQWLPFGATAEDELPTETPNPLQALESQQAAELTYRLLDGLRENDRTVLILFELEGLSAEQIATVTGTSRTNVWVRLHRARNRFRAAFEKVRQ